MNRCIQEKKCISCQHCLESRYHYYTHDNRMVECHLYTCRKHGHTSLQQEEKHCLTWERKKRF